MLLAFTLFFIGLISFILNHKTVILMLISIEVMLLADTLLILDAAHYFEDIMGYVLAVFVLIIAGAESAIGLAIIISFFKLRGSISYDI